MLLISYVIMWFNIKERFVKLIYKRNFYILEPVEYCGPKSHLGFQNVSQKY